MCKALRSQCNTCPSRNTFTWASRLCIMCKAPGIISICAGLRSTCPTSTGPMNTPPRLSTCRLNTGPLRSTCPTSTGPRRSKCPPMSTCRHSPTLHHAFQVCQDANRRTFLHRRVERLLDTDPRDLGTDPREEATNILGLELTFRSEGVPFLPAITAPSSVSWLASEALARSVLLRAAPSPMVAWVS
jgi:hypothetical protein